MYRFYLFVGNHDKYIDIEADTMEYAARIFHNSFPGRHYWYIKDIKS